MNGQTFLGILIVIIALGLVVLVGAPATPISAATTELSRGEIGNSTIAFVLDKALGVAIGIVLTGILGGIGAFAFSAAREAWEDRKAGKWEPGPNANFRRSSPPKQPTLSRDEIFQIALLNAISNGNPGQYVPQLTTTQPEEPPPAEF